MRSEIRVQENAALFTLGTESGYLHNLFFRNPKPIVLMTDDGATVRDHTLRSLEKDVYRVEVAADGRTSLETAQRLKPDVNFSQGMPHDQNSRGWRQRIEP